MKWEKIFAREINGFLLGGYKHNILCSLCNSFITHIFCWYVVKKGGKTLIPSGGKISNCLLAVSQKPVENNNSGGEHLFCKALVTKNVAPVCKIFIP